VFGPTNEPGPDTIEAVAVCGPASIVPFSAFTVIVSTWFVPTAFVAVAGVIWMFASTHAFCAFAPSPGCVSPVSRWITEPPTVTFVDARITDVPVAVDVIVAVHDPVAPTVVQFCVAGVPGPAMIATVHTVPAGAFTWPVPSFTLMWHVSTWFVPTAFAAVGGVSWMFASTTRSGSHAPVDGVYVPSPW